MLFCISKRIDDEATLPKKFNPKKNQRAIHCGTIYTVYPSRDVDYYSKAFCFLVYRKYMWGILPKVGAKGKTNSNIWITEGTIFPSVITAKTMIKIIEFIENKGYDENLAASFAYDTENDFKLVLEEEYASGKLVLPIFEGKKTFYTKTMGGCELYKEGTDVYISNSCRPCTYMAGYPYHHQPHDGSSWKETFELLKAIALREGIEAR